jgi:pseudouridine synthase
MLIVMERLQKILSRAGVASRRAGEQLMLEGRVTVNGVTIRELGTKADPARDDIRVDGRRVKVVEHHLYLLLNKPTGYVSTRSDPEQRPTVMDLLQGVREYVYPVGRLDFDSEGLLLLTNDGDLAARLTHPRHGIVRVYEARVLGVPDAHDLRRLARGIPVDGRTTEPADIEMLGEQGGVATLLVTIREGRNRQVRKMCDAIGHPVRRLTRVAIGPIRDAKLKLGHWRQLTDAEVRKLRAAAAGTGAGKATAAPKPTLTPQQKPKPRHPGSRERREARMGTEGRVGQVGRERNGGFSKPNVRKKRASSSRGTRGRSGR